MAVCHYTSDVIGVLGRTRGASFPIDYAVIASQASVHFASVLCHVSSILFFSFFLWFFFLCF